MEEEAEFNWEEYMEETGASPAPHTAFKHVSDCVRSSPQTEIQSFKYHMEDKWRI